MRKLALVLLLMASCATAWARESVGIPQVTIKTRDGVEPLEIRELKVSVETHGWLAETVYELEVFNHTNRTQEGEFSLQLPEGATVSTWAIDIEGKMRPAVAVEKERALNAYETIKRKMIDPGIVERQEDNRYRTRIFPLPREGTRRMRIGFIQRLGQDGRYVLPLRHDTEIGSFRCEIFGTGIRPTYGNEDRGKFHARSADKKNEWSWEEDGFHLDGELVVQAELPGMNKPLIRTRQADAESCHFIVQGLLDPQLRAADARPGLRWKPFHLLWDASYSGRFRDHETELAELERLWKWLGDVDVNLRVLRYGGSEEQVFRIRDGKADSLNKFLREITYDGALDLRTLEPSGGTTILVTDGGLLSPALRPEKPFIDNFHVLSHQRPDPFLHDLGGMWADFQTDWLAQLQTNGGPVRVGALPRNDYDVWMDGDRFIVTGKTTFADLANIQVHATGMRDIKLRGNLPIPKGIKWNFVRRAWAQRHLEVLEQFGAVDTIRTFAMNERLASDHTSLIVLERFEDHITYRIPPPEPDQLARYEQEIRRKNSSDPRGLQVAWKSKLNWHKTEFPWVDEAVREEASLVAIWVKSSREAFPKEKLNTAALKPYEEWLERALDIIKEGNSVESAENLNTWRQKLDSLLQQLNTLRQKGIDPEKGEPVHVSVRGFVKKRGIYTSVAPAYLSEFIGQAGGVNMYGDLTHTFLYRDARRFGYNLRSSQYKDVPLRWGDMIVVEREPDDPYSDVDPFSDSGALAARPPQPPTFDAPVPRKQADPGNKDPFAGASRPSQKEGSPTVGEIRTPELPVSSTELADEWRDGLNDNTAAFYQKILHGEHGRQPFSFAIVVEIAGIFFEKGEKELGEQVLSNLLELYSNPIEGTRAFAYWLDEYGSKEKARQLLMELGQNLDDEATRALVSYDLGRITGDTAYFVDVIKRSPELNPAPAVVALTDYFAKAGAEVSSLSGCKPESMRSDLRVVLTMAGGDLAPRMREPEMAKTVWNSGAYSMKNSRVYEFQVRRAWTGDYRLIGDGSNSEQPVTVRVEWFHHWGTENEKKKSRTMLVQQADANLGSMSFKWER